MTNQPSIANNQPALWSTCDTHVWRWGVLFALLLAGCAAPPPGPSAEELQATVAVGVAATAAAIPPTALTSAEQVTQATSVPRETILNERYTLTVTRDAHPYPSENYEPEILISPPPEQDGRYPAGTVVTLRVGPYPECSKSGFFYYFMGWEYSNDKSQRAKLVGTSTITITMDADKTVWALLDETEWKKCEN